MENAGLKFIASLCITIIGFFLAYFFTKKPKIRFFYGAITEIKLPPQPCAPIKDADVPEGATTELSTTTSTNFIVRSHLEEEINITPQQIGLFKIEKHQAFIRAWIKDKTDLSFDLVWGAREQWIEELSRQDRHT